MSAVSYSPSIVTMAVSAAILEIFNVKIMCELQYYYICMSLFYGGIRLLILSHFFADYLLSGTNSKSCFCVY